ncbi:DNA-binding transcriptional regulator, GntR family [Paramicrobacterium humi]|uniref:DNA-binding transcriptional regulator, GntR family n=1 Tax=Paramicrobacterium humi TaxID=640635 RepID=A0A1H4LBZ0_9MICO|nr:GntR family transcriptional regulator [Microbacterium humi]SEB67988.1 DNA-binding transcriptional regulator, GntR family [Microbacterium humi]
MDNADQYSTKSDFAYAVIRNRILAHEYVPGATINQATLAKEIGISTTPLREALRRLKQEGLVELDAHRDAYVTKLSVEEARDLLELRLALDPLAAALAAERRTREDIAEIRRSSEVNALSNQPTVVDLVAHRRFHRAIYVASHNDVLIATLDGLWDKADRYRLVGLREGRDQPERDKKNEEHQQLVLAVIAGNPDEAAAVMRAHISDSLGARAAWFMERNSTSV